ncbi:acyl-CoA dehydrogenase family protein [Saccharopolyspora spinosa]|uniref:Acyl-CoA dehydrogenase-like protein n=1 Tax=Saccharopolyspora spinosa TaxID=60894 RepID=A0A2N3Y108_SACSN|nr:acyl-CoA dehydrogenase family protein [Saccharopolyspora spinosa]PKW16531.1 acyl-CoA dehydrogenase-like protein [Saccharopolyspora spinosa]
MTQLIAGKIGNLAAEGIWDLLARSLGGEPIARYTEEGLLHWETLRDGGWDEIGVPEEAGGAGASLRDLVEVAMTWGEFCVPLPLVVTLAAKRWSAAAREHPGPVTVSVSSACAGPLVPFGNEPGIRVLAGPDGFLAVAGGATDEFSLTLRPMAADEATAFDAVAARELAVLWAAEGVGAAKRCLRDAVAYAKGRKQFGVPIGGFQAIKHRAAHMLELTERAETAVLWAAADDFREGAEPVSTRRLTLHALATAREVVESAIQVHGGMGFTWEMGVHVYLRHVIALRELVQGLLPE